MNLHLLRFPSPPEKLVKILAGDAHDIGFSDMPELRLKLHGIVGACSELLGRAEKRAREEAERRDARDFDAVPAIGGGL